MRDDTRKLAIVTGASRGIGFQLARLAAKDGYDLVVAARDADRLSAAARLLRELGVSVEEVAGDLAEIENVDRLVDAVGERKVHLLMANAGHGLGKAFLDRGFDQIRHVVDTNVTGTIYLIHRVGRWMKDAGGGRILITGSIAGTMPAPFHAVYHASKAFIDSFAASIRNEMENDGIVVTCLMPGATATDFFAEADMLDAKVADSAMATPADVARTGYDALMRGDPEVVHGLMNRLSVAMAGVAPSSLMARQSRRENQPGSRG